MHFVGFATYIVASARNGTLYAGHTDELLRRAEEHRLGTFKGFFSKYACRYLPWFEAHDSRDDAFRRERQIKKWRRVWKLDLIEALNPLWLDLGQVPHWPVPDRAKWPELYAGCMEFRIPH